MLIKRIEDFLEDGERIGVVHLTQDIGQLVFQESVIIVEACAARICD